MFVVIKLDVYGYEAGGRPEKAFGPFSTHEQADEFRENKELLNEYGVEYTVIDFLGTE